jgi:hypothetical protein
MSPRDSDRGAPRSEWEAYADYKSVSDRVAEHIDDAIDALCYLESSKDAGYKPDPDEEADYRAVVLTAATSVKTELENERDLKTVYDEILNRWEGEDGYINRFREVDVTGYGRDGWMYQFAEDLHRAGWELGYLKAGREKQIGESGDGHDGELRDMIEGMRE